MIVTLFTDASFDPRYNIATWAAWAKTDRQTERAAGAFRTPVSGVNAAELGAIANGLHMVVMRLRPEPLSTVLIESDSMHALGIVRGMQYRMQSDEITFRAFIMRFSQQYGLILRTKHVKGHRGNRDARAAVNSWCNRRCYAELRRLRLQQDSAALDSIK